MMRALMSAGLAVALLASGCSRSDEGNTDSNGRSEAAVLTGGTATVHDTAIADDGQWLMAAKDYANTRFSGLDEINTSNVGNLEMAWSFSTGIPFGHEAAPLVVGNRMYIISPFPNKLFALDLDNSGELIWTYEPPVLRAAKGVACCDVVNRGAAYYNGRIYFNTLDNQTVAVDAESGREVWRTTLGDINRGESMTMAPIVVKGKVIVGNSGGEFGVRGWITALDADNGSIVWRAYNTGPDKDILFGERFHPFYAADTVPNLGQSTWPPDRWRTGGGSVWGWLSYDPELDLLYYGSGNPGPWNAEQRPGDNKWTASLIARDPDDGQAVWAYQFSPHDLFDHDGINESILVDMPWGESSEMRQLLIHPERNGYMYVMDRGTGQVLAADTFVHVTAYLGVDLETGRLKPNEEKHPMTGKVTRDICPASPGAKDWQPSAFSPRTRLLYIPHNNLCMDFEAVEANYIAGTPYVGALVRYYAGPGGNAGEYSAWDPIARRKVFSIKERWPVWSGTVVTAGDVAFYGTMDGWFKAIDARNGRLLWQKKLASGIIAQPVTYRGPDGRQYVAVFSGIGGWPGAIIANDLMTDDPTAANGWGDAMRDLKGRTTPGSTLYVFALQ
jgi:PQQ-dependent dehydrogenase (methanol/ethanol family)